MFCANDKFFFLQAVKTFLFCAKFLKHSHTKLVRNRKLKLKLGEIEVSS